MKVLSTSVFAVTDVSIEKQLSNIHLKSMICHKNIIILKFFLLTVNYTFVKHAIPNSKKMNCHANLSKINLASMNYPLNFVLFVGLKKFWFLAEYYSKRLQSCQKVSSPNSKVLFVMYLSMLKILLILYQEKQMIMD